MGQIAARSAKSSSLRKRAARATLQRFPALKTLPALAIAALLAFGSGSRGEEPAAIPLADALTRTELKCEWTGNGCDRLSLAVSNPAATALAITIPAGLIAANPAGGDRLIVLRAAQATIPARATTDVALPAAALSAKNAAATGPYRLTADTEPRLAGLLKFLADKPDAPKPTSQLAALALLENITFPQWQQYLLPLRAGEPPDQTHPTPAEVAQAIDALGILRALAPKQAFALATDAELKFRALRNPWCRAKAMQLYGIALPASDGGVPPDIRELLHLTPGDNCPICRQRAQMQAPASEL